ncbi:MAG: hypothetical protein GX650_07100 [Clostridiales bacterium]|nr:hypothetical protein [Clostridiales bacterium]
MRKDYQKPSVQFVSINTEERVADVCWGSHGSNMYYYWLYDNNKQALRFNIGGTSCGGAYADNIEYTLNGPNQPDQIDFDARAALEEYIRKLPDNEDSAYKGSVILTTITIDPSFRDFPN